MRANQIYWEDVEVGDELPGYDMDIDARRMVLQLSGSQDHYPVHFDRNFARAAGHEEVFMSSGFTEAALVRVITDWMGDEGWLRKLRLELRRQNRIGDTMVCKGSVASKYVQDGDHYVECDVWAENQREGVTTPGRAWIILPSREAGRG
jgi:hypothetical protein